MMRAALFFAIIAAAAARQPLIAGIGYGHTGTTSLATALEQMGYRTEHWTNKTRHLMCLGLSAGHHYDKKQLLLGAGIHESSKNFQWGWNELDDVDAVLDEPVNVFWRHIYHKFPDTKFILTTRDEDTWADSEYNWWPHDEKGRMIPKHNNMQKQYWGWCNEAYGINCINKFLELEFGTSRPTKEDIIKARRKHEEEVRATIPAEQLLVFQVDKGDGYEKLSQFLNKPRPVAKDRKLLAFPNACNGMCVHRNGTDHGGNYKKHTTLNFLRTAAPKKVEKVFVINMDSRADKWNAISAKLNKTDLEYERFAAITPKKGYERGDDVYAPVAANGALKMYEMQRNDPVRFYNVMGCFLSHLAVLEHIYETGQPGKIYMVLEDDHYPVRDINQNLPEILKGGISDWDAIRLDCWSGKLKAQMKKRGKEWIKARTREDIKHIGSGGSHAILYRYEGIPKIIKNWKNQEWRAADEMFFSKQFNSYCVNMDMVADTFMESDIPKSKEEEEMHLARREKAEEKQAMRLGKDEEEQEEQQ